MVTFNTEDTIVARGSPPGRGGVSVIRLSGPQAGAIGQQLLGKFPEPRVATLTDIGSGEVIDKGIALFFPAPNSFTGEDVLELQVHGSPVITEMVIEAACAAGARLAEAGEFSRRAFLNDKMDLAQAEAIADLIDSSSRAAARAAQRSMQGDFSALVLALNEQVTMLRVYVEAALDFPEEEIDFLSDTALAQRVTGLEETFTSLEQTVRQGCLLRDGVTIVLAGRPNAGKSSLLNALAGYDAAIVTEVAGTTRDLIREHLEIHGLPVTVVDTAGLRESGDRVEAEGIRRAQRELANADHALVIVDVTTSSQDEIAALRKELPAEADFTVVYNKIDLTDARPGIRSDDKHAVYVSALTGEGIDDLRRHLEIAFGYRPAAEGSVIARQRHMESLQKAQRHFVAACAVLQESAAGELMAEELLQVQNALAEITGQFSSDDLLGRIFESFCIGK